MNDLLKINQLQHTQPKVLLPINPSQMHNNNNNILHHSNMNQSSSNNNSTFTLNGKRADRSTNTKRTLSNANTTDDPTTTASVPKRVKSHQQQQHQRSDGNPGHRHGTFVQPSAPQTAPQLLQQLMAPTPQQQQQQNQRDRDRKVDRSVSLEEVVRTDAGKWSTSGSSTGLTSITRQNAAAPAASNSVLKNLLVSGCDVNAGYVCVVPMRAKKALKT